VVLGVIGVSGVIVVSHCHLVLVVRLPQWGWEDRW